MAKIPDYTALGPRPVPESAWRPVQPPDNMLAPERAQIQLAGAIGGIGEAIQKRQEQIDTVQAEDAYNKLLQQKQDLTLGQEGFSHKNGSNALTPDFIPGYRGKFDAAATKIGDSLTNDRQKALYRERANIAARQFNHDLVIHATKAADEQAQEVLGQGIILETRNAADRYNDPNAVGASLARVKGLISQAAERNGWPKDMKDNAIQKAKSGVYEQIIQAAVNDENPTYARELFKQHENDIVPEKRLALGNLVKRSGLVQLGQDAADHAMALNMSQTDALDWARKKYKGDEETAAVNQIKIRFQEKQQAQNQDYKHYSDIAWGYLANKSPAEYLQAYNSIPKDVLHNMAPKEQIAIQKYAQDPPVQTDYKRYQDIIQQMAKDPKAFTQRNLLLDKPYLSEGDWKMFEKAQAGLGAGKPENFAVALTRQQVINQAIDALGGDHKNLSKDSTTQAVNRINMEINTFQAENGRNPNNAELQAITDRLKIESLRSHHFIGIPYWFTTKTPVGEFTQEDIPEVPIQYVDEIARNLQAIGQPVTKENIIAAWQYYNQKPAGQ